MIELTIKLDTEKVETAIRDAWAQEFSTPNRYQSTSDYGAGWKEVLKQVKLHIETLDLSDLITRATKAQLDGVVNDIVTVALKEKARQKTKEMMRDGTLLGLEEK